MTCYRLFFEPGQRNENLLELTPEQRHYLTRVLRLQPGENFVALDGTGQAWSATLTTVGANLASIAVPNTELPVSLTLAVALPKGSGFDDIVRAGTELGVTAFAPIISDRTLLKPSSNRLTRWKKIATEAAEQSERLKIPRILSPQKFTDFCRNAIPSPGNYLCVARGDRPTLAQQYLSQKPSSIILLTGPEGGWTEAEITFAIAENFQPVSLGSSVLRAVTAPIAGAALISGLST
ncbi:MAG: 16S rRNA (uracil(1498)-N(3))-methyltransferase [Cyanobacteria bacterium P01_H01_bin.15]